MPRHTTTLQIATMDARLAAIEASLEGISQLIQSSITATNSSLVAAMNTKVYVILTKLRLSRAHDHKISLVLGAKLSNIRPCHHGPVRKSEIKKAVQELLDVGYTRHSHSPFSFPVLLVKKIEGTWRLCMDYRKLNNIIIKDKCPIPLIDDLLNELFQALPQEVNFSVLW